MHGLWALDTWSVEFGVQSFVTQSAINYATHAVSPRVVSCD